MSRTAADIRVDLTEIEDELQDMIGAVDGNIEGFTIDEKGVHERLLQRKAGLEMELHTINNGGTSEENASNTAASSGHW